jgi:ubiquinol-cytochrome c reductase cytochrome b subunit
MQVSNDHDGNEGNEDVLNGGAAGRLSPEAAAMLPPQDEAKLPPTSRWLRKRVGWNEMVSESLYHPVPRHTSIADLLGMFTLIAFVNEVVTGIILLFFYHPTSAAAWASMHALIATPAGRLLRGLHYWGANAMIVLVGAHLLRVVFIAGYKKPRELQWISGILLLALTIGLGFTGYLLPWDQQAYWATMVGTSIPRYAPVIGPWIVQVMRGGPWINGATLGRFFAVHVMLLPLLLALVLGGHVYMVMANGQTSVERELPEGYREKHKLGDTSDFPASGFRPFWPYTVAQMVGGMLIVVAVIVALAMIYPAPLLNAAEPLNQSNYNPIPVWYFDWIYQLLKMTPPALDSTIMIYFPTVGGIFLILLPWLDRNKFWQPVRRKAAMTVTGVLTVGVLLLTYVGINSGAPLPATAAIAKPSFSANIEPIFRAQCAQCHMINPPLGGLNLGTYAGVMKGGLFGAAIKPGDPAGSLMIQALEGKSTKVPQMPFGLAPLPKGDIQTIANWIKEGAPNN